MAAPSAARSPAAALVASTSAPAEVVVVLVHFPPVKSEYSPLTTEGRKISARRSAMALVKSYSRANVKLV
jgi:predicted phosphohydrolase